jgi:GTPase SAR1 family protein
MKIFIKNFLSLFFVLHHFNLQILFITTNYKNLNFNFYWLLKYFSMEKLFITVFGEGGVGKSSFTIQYAHNQFVEMYDPTIDDVYRKEIVFQDKNIVLHLHDTGYIGFLTLSLNFKSINP